MIHRLLNLLTALSLLVGVAVVVLWVRSYRTDRDHIKFGWANRDFYIIHSRGGALALVHIAAIDPRTGQLIEAGFPSAVIPHFLLLVVAGIIPVLVVAHHQVTIGRRRKRGLCLSCGYDLRATPGRCPECGSVRWTSS